MIDTHAQVRYLCCGMETLIDFCYKEFGTLVQSSTVFEDNFALENLLDTNFKSKGFRVETFVRPPVEITFTFKNPVHLSRIEFSSPASEFIEVWGAERDADFYLVGRVHQKAESPKSVLKNYYFPGNDASGSQRPESEFCLFTKAVNRGLLRNLTREAYFFASPFTYTFPFPGQHIVIQPTGDWTKLFLKVPLKSLTLFDKKCWK